MNDPSLHAHRLLIRVALSLVHAFAWVFVFEYFYYVSGDMNRSLAAAALLYASVQFIVLFATPISAAHLRRGTKHSIIWGTLAAAAAFIALGGFLSGYFNTPALWGVIVFAVLLGLHRALYWVPYEVAHTRTSKSPWMHVYFEVLIALMPLFAGITIVSMEAAPERLLFGAATLIALSIVPLLRMRDRYERFSWPYGYTFKQLLRHKNSGLVLHALLEGIQGAALFLIWPLAIFLLVEWSYFLLGLVFSASLLAILILRYIYRAMAEYFGIRNSVVVHTVFAMSGWVARLAAGTPIGIIVADAYSYTTLPERGTRADPATFEHVSDRGSFIDEYTTLKELALALGRIMLCVTVFFLAFVMPLAYVFMTALLTAAVASGLSVLVARKVSIATY